MVVELGELYADVFDYAFDEVIMGYIKTGSKLLTEDEKTCYIGEVVFSAHIAKNKSAELEPYALRIRVQEDLNDEEVEGIVNLMLVLFVMAWTDLQDKYGSNVCISEDLRIGITYSDTPFPDEWWGDPGSSTKKCSVNVAMPLLSYQSRDISHVV